MVPCIDPEDKKYYQFSFKNLIYEGPVPSLVSPVGSAERQGRENSNEFSSSGAVNFSAYLLLLRRYLPLNESRVPTC